MPTVTSEIQRQVDELVSQLDAFAERHGVEAFPAPDLAEQVVEMMAESKMSLDEVLEMTRSAVVKKIMHRSHFKRFQKRSPMIH